MRIAIVSTMINPLSEPYAGGTEAVTAKLASGLAARGHQVAVFATQGSAVPGARLITLDTPAGALRWPATPEAMDGATMRRYLVEEQALFHRLFLQLRAQAADFDLVHNHSFSGLPIILGATLPVPMLTTLHCPPILEEQLAALRVQATASPAALVAVSHALAEQYRPLAPVATVIHNGVEPPQAPEFAVGADLLFVGRLAPEKGADLAIAVARAAHRRLVLVGRIEDQAFFDREIAPALGGREVEYAGQMGQPEVWRLMSHAAAVLFTPRWPEPCSLAVLEAMAHGAPAIAFRTGGLPEQIVDGLTGFLVPPGDIGAAARAVAQLPGISRAACRAHVLRHFSIGAMVSAYERRYAELIEQRTAA